MVTFGSEHLVYDVGYTWRQADLYRWSVPVLRAKVLPTEEEITKLGLQELDGEEPGKESAGSESEEELEEQLDIADLCRTQMIGVIEPEPPASAELASSDGTVSRCDDYTWPLLLKNRRQCWSGRAAGRLCSGLRLQHWRTLTRSRRRRR